MQIKGLIFDFDGLILDTEMPKFLAWSEVYHSFGQEFSLEKYAECIGSSNSVFDPISELQKLARTPLDIQEVKKQQHDRELELLANERVLPGVRELIIEAYHMKIRMAIASSSDRPWVVTHLKRLGLMDYFDAIFTGNDVRMVKPDPELFIKAAKALKIPTHEIIVLEDSPNGIMAAMKAGLFVVGVTNPITRQLNTSMANLILPSLENITIDVLTNMIEKKEVNNDQSN